MQASMVLDCQGDLIERLDLPTVRAVTNHFSFLEVTAGSEVSEGDQDPNEVGGIMTTALHNAVKNASAYSVSFDMCAMLEAAAMELQDETQWNMEFAPTDQGFVRFDKPIEIEDFRGKTMLAHFMVWGRVRTTWGTGSFLWFFNDLWTQADDAHVMDFDDLDKDQQAIWKRMHDDAGRWAHIGVVVVNNGRTVGPKTIDKRWSNSKDEGEQYPATNVVRFVHAFWLMMHQTITVVEDSKLDRAARRRAERRRLPAKVQTILLRRKVYPNREPGESLIEWQHRWPVRGHWAWRKCGEDHRFAEPYEGGWHCWIYVHPYMKGPDDKPILLTDKVYRLAQ